MKIITKKIPNENYMQLKNSAMTCLSAKDFTGVVGRIYFVYSAENLDRIEVVMSQDCPITLKIVEKRIGS